MQIGLSFGLHYTAHGFTNMPVVCIYITPGNALAHNVQYFVYYLFCLVITQPSKIVRKIMKYLVPSFSPHFPKPSGKNFSAFFVLAQKLINRLMLFKVSGI